MNLSKSEIIIQNILECSTDAKRCTAEIDLLLNDLIFNEDFSHRSIFDIKNEICSKYNLLNDARRKNGKSTSEYESAREQLYICKQIIKFLEHKLGLGASIVPKPHSVKIAYWYSNSYAEEACLKFSKLFDECEKLPVDSFTAVCESIDDESSVLGVVPVINSSDGRLMSFYRLLDKYDLKISAVCKVENPNGGGFTKFALVGRRLVEIDTKKKKTIEFLTNKAVSNFISFAESAEGVIGEITSIPSPYGNSEQLNYISISVEQNAIYELWLYLYIFVGDADFIGLYTEI